MSALDASWQVLKDMGQDEAYERTWGRPPGEIGSAPAEESSLPFKVTQENQQWLDEAGAAPGRVGYLRGLEGSHRGGQAADKVRRNMYDRKVGTADRNKEFQLTSEELSDLRNKYWNHIKGKVKGAMPTIPSMFRRNHPNEPQESVDARRRASGDSGKWLPGVNQKLAQRDMFNPQAAYQRRLEDHKDAIHGNRKWLVEQGRKKFNLPKRGGSHDDMGRLHALHANQLRRYHANQLRRYSDREEIERRKRMRGL